MTIDTSRASRIELPPVPSGLRGHAVACWSEPLVIDTYMPLAPDTKPAFFEQRVYQGSTGGSFPLPFHERVSQEKEPHGGRQCVNWRRCDMKPRFLRPAAVATNGLAFQ